MAGIGIYFKMKLTMLAYFLKTGVRNNEQDMHSDRLAA